MEEYESTAAAEEVKQKNLKHTVLIAALCFFLSFLCITIVSKTSFLYSFHDGTDINWFLTVGRGIVKGKVPYKDLYEQKGVLLYMIFALNYLICGNHFYFIYIVQVLLFTCFLYLSYKIILMYKPEKFALFGTLVTSLVVCCCNAYFSGGGEVEEYCLPMVTYGLYVFLQYARRGGDKIPLHQVAFCGIFAGCIFWMKYTMLTFYVAFAVCVFVDRCLKHDVKSGFAYAGVFIGAFAFVSLPWVIYLAVNGAVGDMLQVYIIDNIFSYSTGDSFLDTLGNVLEAIGKVFKNFPLYFFVVCGIVWFVKGVNGIQKPFKIYFSFMIGFLFVVQCLIKGGLSYYHLIMGAFVPLGVAGAVYTVSTVFALVKSVFMRIKTKVSPPVSEITDSTCGKIDACGDRVAQKIGAGSRARTIILSAVAVIIICLLCGNCTLALFYSKESYSQTTLAELIVPEVEEDEEPEEEEEEKDPLYLLCYKILEQGFYAACDEVPEFYYFAKNNFSYESYPELFDEMESYVINGEAVYVVTMMDTWAEEQDTNLARYEFTQDLSYYHIESNTNIQYKEYCLLQLIA